MDRRESLKSMLIGGVAGGLMLTGCEPAISQKEESTNQGTSNAYGRTPEEKVRDERLMAERFFDVHELATIAVLCDIILPAKGNSPSATEVNVPEFVEFITKDLPYHQLPLRGGIMWLDHLSRNMYDQEFIELNDQQQITIVDKIAYPEPPDQSLLPGVKFFDRIRNLVLTGYYTTRAGLDDLGYKGNIPNVWDGVPQEVLDKHGMSYNEEWMPIFVDQSQRNVKAEWDEEGNLIS